MRKPIMKVALVLLLLIIAAGLFFSFRGGATRDAADTNSQIPPELDLTSIGGTLKKGGYEEYLSKFTNASSSVENVIIEGENFSKVDGMNTTVLEDYKGRQGKALLTEETGSVSWDVQIKKAGLYNIRMNFYSEAGKSSDIERELKIDGKIPFNEARSFIFNRIWGNEKNTFDRDDRGNDLAPNQVETQLWRNEAFRDSTGFYQDPFLFYFSEGKHTLTLTSVREPLVIDQLILSQEDLTPTYDEIASNYKQDSLNSSKDVFIKLQAEETLYKSTPSLLPYNDRSNPAVEPFHVSKLRNNAMGGFAWRLPGQWIEWEFEVPEDGLYQIALKNRQNFLRGMSSLRTVYIDGEVPFKELKSFPFPYSADWQTQVIGKNNTEPYLFELEKGKHTIRMEVTLGDLSPILRSVESTILELNSMYRTIISYTGTVPDPFRDYNLEQRIPEMTELFSETSERLYNIAKALEGPSGKSDDKTSIINTVAYQLKDMAENPETVPSRVEAYKANVGALSSWMLTINEQPLALDYLIVSSPGAKLPKAKAGQLDKIVTDTEAFLASFYENYDDFSADQDDQKSVTVWVTSARDQAQVIKKLIDDQFTAKTGIHVNLKLVAADVILPSTVAGKGPDVAIQIGSDLPVNYASRNALQNLSEFSDFNTVKLRFNESALVPFEYLGDFYALPETQTFPMLFYRKDILEDELKLEVPQTWDDVYAMLPVLQKNNLQFGLPQKPLDSMGNETANTNIATLPISPALIMFLYQNDGNIFKNGGMSTDLDSEVAMKQFKQWTDFFVNYKIPIAADFANRFRTGEMPIGVVDYTMYNKLNAFAPEIKGLWSFAPVPGTMTPDGKIHREVGSSGSASVMFKGVKDKESAWTFLKWWTEKDTQVAFGRQMEIRMGAAARYPTANKEALAELPWPTQDFRKLEEQMQWARGIPEVPGGYLTGRNIDNAFRRVVVQGEDPRETLENYVRIMNEELTLKRKEFNLPYEK